jgi:2-C-methyl-D-erythritol 4-phosphate cytidylyltransferase/2-C-methyl-D-erythritol 2,4-cyclodiphosphate synthase
MKVAAVLLAAGRSARFGRDKLALPLRGRPVWRWAFDAFRSHPRVSWVGIVASPERLADCLAAGADACLAGGETRQQSARAGLLATPDDAGVVLVHDAARPCVTAELIDRVIGAIESHGAAVPALPVTETIKEAADGGLRTLDRARLLAVQTPQGALRSLLMRAHAVASDNATDDASLLEAIGVEPIVVEGDPRNVKVTAELDYQSLVARFEPCEVRTGFGYDAHRFAGDPARPLWLGCVRFEGATGLEGHSDADAVAHAAVDALMGATGKGDIGQVYPDADPRWRGAPSSLFLEGAAASLDADGWEIVNIDISVVAEAPKLMPRRLDMCQAIAAALRIEADRVSVKATTNERLGAIGRGEGIAAFAVATVRRTRR